MEYEIWFSQELKKLQERISFFFSDISLLKTALIHSSYAYETGKNEHNERMEFLGDAVLQLTVSQFLFSSFPKYDEGKLTRLRATIVCARALSEWANDIGLCELLRTGKGMRLSDVQKSSVCSDTAEALFGAIFLDGGFQASLQVIQEYLRFHLARYPLSGEENDPKSSLQILSHEHGFGVPMYEILSIEGPSHSPRFLVQVKLGAFIAGQGKGVSRKSAEFNAAKEGVLFLMNRKRVRECK